MTTHTDYDQLIDNPRALGARESQGRLLSPTAQGIVTMCDEIKALLLAKNAAYGDSAMLPVRIFSRADAVEQLLVRIDDKLSRVARGHELGDDTILDLIGYLILLRVVRGR